MTMDSDVVRHYLQDAYRTKLRFSGMRDGYLYSHSRLDGGVVAIDEVRLPLHMRVAQDPFNSLLMINLLSGRFERDCGGVSERFAGGDIFIDAEPTLPSMVELHAPRLQAILLDLPVLAQVASGAPGRKPGEIRWTGYRPVSKKSAVHLKHTISYVGEVLANAEVATHPLIRGSVTRLLAAAALSTFPNTALIEPLAQDRRDATSVTVRRAVAFIEAHADLDLSVADIATAASVSIRAVQFAFRRHLDTTPMRYLQSVRLDRVHRELLAAKPAGDTTVTGVATRWGFYNHSRFVARYRRAYGVNPWDTLRNR